MSQNHEYVGESDNMRCTECGQDSSVADLACPGDPIARIAVLESALAEAVYQISHLSPLRPVTRPIAQGGTYWAYDCHIHQSYIDEWRKILYPSRYAQAQGSPEKTISTLTIP